MPEAKLIAPIEIPYTDERLGISSEMLDDDNMQHGVEGRFYAHASLEEGVSGLKSIDTLYENTSEDYIDTPRSAVPEKSNRGKTANHEGVNNPAPECINTDGFPHRRY